MDRSNEVIGATAKKIKKENPDEDINEFAETAMNELLGWYGYGSTRDEPKMSRLCNSQPGSNSSDADSPKCADGCEWCGKPVDENKALASSGSTFCSELCFSQSRRANFKKNKVCDWCRHVRHTVSYVDFQDGASQLQFCSDKCLNQYKMHIFCRETRAHLELHPHLPDDAATLMGNLITPDLWLRNCKSPDQTTPSPPESPKHTESLPQTSPLPLIRVAHPSKFMAPLLDSPDSPKKQKMKTQRKQRKKCCTATAGAPLSDSPQDLRIRQSPPRELWEPNPFRTPHDHRTHIFNNFPKFAHNPSFNPLHPPPLQYPRPPPQSSSLLPPVTVLVPYPIIIPLPLPIPIPITLTSDGKIKLPDKPSQKSNEKSPGANDKVAEERVVTEDEKEEVEINENDRHFRKRKRITDPKIKLGSVKNKKSVPV